MARLWDSIRGHFSRGPADGSLSDAGESRGPYRRGAREIFGGRHLTDVRRNPDRALRRLNRRVKEQGVRVVPSKAASWYMKRFGFDPAVVLDVGVFRGTQFLYESFPEAHHVLIDPLPGFDERVRRRCGDGYHFTFVYCAAGEETSRSMLQIQAGSEAKSTLNPSTAVRRHRAERAVEVDIRRIDDLVDDLGLEGPFGLKIDSEGHELAVLKGAPTTLSSCQFVIAEISIRQRFSDGYRFSDVVGYLAEHGFELIDILNPAADVPLFVDGLFVPADSSLF